MLPLHLPLRHAVREVMLYRVVLKIVALVQQILLHVAPRQIIVQEHLLVQGPVHEVNLLWVGTVGAHGHCLWLSKVIKWL
jgi:hypothetical protein